MKEMANKLKALGDPTRLRILHLLLYGELCVCDIQQVLEASQPFVSRHLFYLKSAGLVSDRREGYRVFYKLLESSEDATCRSIVHLLKEVAPHEPILREDLKTLRDAIKDGSCQLIQSRAFPKSQQTASMERHAN